MFSRLKQTLVCRHTWRMSALIKTIALLLISGLSYFFCSAFLELGQCERRCSDAYADEEPSVRGQRSRLFTQQCHCISGDDRLIGTVSRWYPWQPPPVATSVCGQDGRTYASRAEADQNGVGVIHAGHCGKCSNECDIGIFIATRDNLTEIATRCAFKNLLFGGKIASQCLQQLTGLTDECTQCWVDNMSCTAVHCVWECLWARLVGLEPNKPDGSLNDCLRCDEGYCGSMFIECAGANRRRIGVVTDIGRDQEEIWSGSN